MTYEEAIEYLKWKSFQDYSGTPYELAIEALEKQMLIKEKINEVITELDVLQETATVDYRTTSDVYFAGGAYAYDIAKKVVVELYKTFGLE